jgi:DivIVA domain-containing protein
VTLFWVLLGIAVLGGVAVVASGRGEGMPATEPDRADLTLPQDRPAAREDVDRLRFSVGLRGYRMDEVDDVLDRLALDIALRDSQLVELRTRLGEGPADAQPEPLEAEPDVPEPDVPEPDVPERAAEGPVDSAISRTLLVPLEQYEPDREAEGG